MTRSVYVVGGAGVGKSTFMSQLLNIIGDPEHGPSELVDLHSKPNSRGTMITLRGHYINGGDGIYLGCMRDSFPGTDGLDRVSYIPGEEWLLGPLPDFIIGEGATLAVRRFIRQLRDSTDLLLVHLVCDPEVKAQRILGRGSQQAEQFVLGTATRSANLVRDFRDSVAVLGIETSSADDWEIGLDIAASHLRN